MASLALLVTVLTAQGWTEGNGVPGPQATWGAASGQTVHPGAVVPPSSGGSPSAASAEEPVELAQGRLRNLDRGLCLDLRDGEVRTDARAELAECSSAVSQQWSYRDNGLLRSAADPTLCLDSDPDEGTVVLANCLAHAGEVRYDLTVHGELLPRRSEGLAVASGDGVSVVLDERDGSEAQRWLLDGGLADVHGERPEKQLQQEEPRVEKNTAPVAPERESPDGVVPELPQGGAEAVPEEDPQSPYGTRYVQDESGHEAEPAAPVDAVAALPVEVPAAAATVVGTATTTLGSALHQSLH